jgi:predicted NodU family carbamoyl transferase
VSPYDGAAIVTVDVGEWATSTICKGLGNDIHDPQESASRTRSVSSTARTPTPRLQGEQREYKVMGLAPYGEPMRRQVMETISYKDGSFKIT